MKKPSLNHIYRLVWNDALGVYVPVAEFAGARRKRSGSAAALTAALLLSGPALAADLPTGGNVVAGAGSISQNGSAMTINQQTGKMAVDWQSFSIGKGSSVTFKQPGRDSVALNRVLGPDVSVIQGALNANGQVFLVNPNGVVFTPTAQVNVGGIVASTLNISTQDFLAGNYRFEGASSNAIINQGNITAAPGGSIALIAAKITNTGNLTADKGNVLLGAGSRVKLDLGGPVKIEVEQGAIDALIEQGGAIRADGGTVYLTAKAAGDLASTVINHTGITQAKTLATGENGKIVLLGDMVNDRIAVAGTLDASAPNGGKGGFVETSAAKVSVAAGALITTKAVSGQHGSWLVDPTDFTVSAGTTGQTDSGIGADTLSVNLNNGNIELQTVASGAQAGNISVNAGVTWSADTKLTLSAHGNIYLNAPITATGANAGLALNHGGFTQNGSVAAGTDYRVNSPVTLSGANSTFSVNGNAYTLIRSVAQLKAIDGLGTGRYALAQDLDATGVAFSQTVVGTDVEFNGAFDGLGHAISNVNGEQGFLGVFGITGAGSDIRNLGVVNINMNSWDFAGGLVGYNQGRLDNVYAIGNISGGDMGGGGIGGLVGINFGSISNAYSSGTVKNSEIAGPMMGNMGGLVGTNYGTVDKSYSTSVVTEGMFSTPASGALVGYNAGTVTASFASSTDAAGNAYTTAPMTRLTGIVGNTSNSGMKTAAQLSQLATFKNAGWDIDAAGGTGATWRMYEGNGGPLLRGFLKQVTVSLADKVYDGRVSGGIGYVSSQPGAQLGGSINYTTNSKNAGVYRLADGTLTVNGGLYSNQQGYDIVYADGLALNVLKKGVSVGFTAQDKTYDGTLGASVNGMVGIDVLAGDILGVGGTGSFSDKNAGAGKTVYIGGVALTGLDANNYFITTGSSATTTASITPRELTGSVTIRDKVYDGGIRADGQGSVSGLLPGDAYSLNMYFADKNVGTNKQVVFALSGLDAGNYVLGAGLNALTATITPKAVTAALTAGDKIYDGTTTATVSGLLYGAINGDMLSLMSGGDFLNKNVGVGKDVFFYSTLTGLDARNYRFTFNAQSTATITPKALTGAITAAGKTYDGTRDAVTSGRLTGVVQGDTVMLASTGLFADKNAGVGKSVTLDGSLLGIHAGNYTLSYNGTTTADITPKAITGALSAASKVYDGSLDTVISGVLFGAVLGDNVGIGGTGRFGDKNAGVGKQVAVSGMLSGADAGNYLLTANTMTWADITPKALTGAITAAGKTYDGTTAASTTGSLNGVVVGDTVALSTSGAFADKNAAIGKRVNVNGTLTGADAGNYTLSANATTTATIERRVLGVAGTTVAGKTYDGSAIGQASAGALSNLVGGETLGVGATATFDSANAGNRNASVRYALADSDTGLAANYVLADTQHQAVIDRRAITVAADDKTKRAGNADPALTWRIAQGNLVANDTLAGVLNRAAGETAGNYRIGADGLSNANYLIATQDGTLSISNAVQPDSRRESALSTAQWLQAAVGTANTTPPTLPGDLSYVPVSSGSQEPGQGTNAQPAPNAGQGARSVQGPARLLVIDGGIRLPEGAAQGGI
ncbi:YDG domain-containing protein [Achromobacter sp. UMC46]|uniref:YDG domain-containing protein n=1 Tax=Achromobacter sp. UMC46 TaxID=1862319 RepID=UPI0015FF8FF8|nr:YDG domain-containing protein [Achromobacter sp. UMC46]MBB1595324.1 hypothetical protein [Achromobacter sp. UMC46]